MAYNIIATAQIPAADEDALKTALEQVKAYVTSKNGTINTLIREVEEPEE